MWVCVITIGWVAVFSYSIMCAPEIYFRLFRFRDTPEYDFGYLAFCLVCGITGTGAVVRLAALLIRVLKPNSVISLKNGRNPL